MRETRAAGRFASSGLDLAAPLFFSIFNTEFGVLSLKSCADSRGLLKVRKFARDGQNLQGRSGGAKANRQLNLDCPPWLVRTVSTLSQLPQAQAQASGVVERRDWR